MKEKRLLNLFLEGIVVVSVITEIELLGWHKLNEKEKSLLHLLLNDCVIFDLTADIRKLAIQIKQQVKIKTPDAIIAATSRYLQIPLVTSDKDFRIVPDIELILI